MQQYKQKVNSLEVRYQKIFVKNMEREVFRVVEGDSVTILRGEFKGVDGKVAKVSTDKKQCCN